MKITFIKHELPIKKMRVKISNISYFVSLSMRVPFVWTLFVVFVSLILYCPSLFVFHWFCLLHFDSLSSIYYFTLHSKIELIFFSNILLLWNHVLFHVSMIGMKCKIKSFLLFIITYFRRILIFGDWYK